MPDFNNSPGNDLNSTRILGLRPLFETDVNNDPPQAIPNPVSDGEYNTSVQVSYLWFSGGCLTPPQSCCSTFLQRTLPNAQGCFVAGSLLCKSVTV